MFRIIMNLMFVVINCYFDKCLICKLFIHQFSFYKNESFSPFM